MRRILPLWTILFVAVGLLLVIRDAPGCSWRYQIWALRSPRPILCSDLKETARLATSMRAVRSPCRPHFLSEGCSAVSSTMGFCSCGTVWGNGLSISSERPCCDRMP